MSASATQEQRAVAATARLAPNEALALRLGAEETGIDILRVQKIGSFAQPTRTVGAVLDSVSDGLRLQAEQIKPAPEFGGSLDAQHITGIAAIDNGQQQRMLILLDVQQLLAGADIGLP